MAQKEEYVKSIFNEKLIFEKSVLNVFSDVDRLDIMRILAKKLIRGDLKEELNFLYMKDFSHFKFSLITNLLFKEFANEWILFAEEELVYTREKALEEIQDKSRINYIYMIVKRYFNVYKRAYTQEIANTFIELVEIDPNFTLNNPLIKTVLQSELLKRNNVNVIHNYNQLWSRVKGAHDLKSMRISKIQIKISELSLKLDDNVSEDEKQNIIMRLEKYEKEAQNIKDKSLSHFDEAVKRVKETMVESMLKADSLESLL